MSHDPTYLRGIANGKRAYGYNGEADALEAVAANIEALTAYAVNSAEALKHQRTALMLVRDRQRNPDGETCRVSIKDLEQGIAQIDAALAKNPQRSMADEQGDPRIGESVPNPGSERARFDAWLNETARTHYDRLEIAFAWTAWQAATGVNAIGTESAEDREALARGEIPAHIADPARHSTRTTEGS